MNDTDYDLGYGAYFEGKQLTANPYTADKILKCARWTDGWIAACEDDNYVESDGAE